uniref:Uncharacterized protein n=1 Tax=Glossina pallidipes TaxID=7398 RepID=A0A1B0A4E7_GLOPL
MLLMLLALSLLITGSTNLARSLCGSRLTISQNGDDLDTSLAAFNKQLSIYWQIPHNVWTTLYANYHHDRHHHHEIQAIKNNFLPDLVLNVVVVVIVDCRLHECASMYAVSGSHDDYGWSFWPMSSRNYETPKKLVEDLGRLMEITITANY